MRTTVIYYLTNEFIGFELPIPAFRFRRTEDLQQPLLVLCICKATLVPRRIKVLWNVTPYEVTDHTTGCSWNQEDMWRHSDPLHTEFTFDFAGNALQLAQVLLSRGSASACHTRKTSHSIVPVIDNALRSIEQSVVRKCRPSRPQHATPWRLPPCSVGYRNRHVLKSFSSPLLYSTCRSQQR